MNMFEKAKKVQTPKAEPKGKGKKKHEVEIAQLELFASVRAVQKALDGLVEGIEEEIKDDVAGEFITLGLREGKRPENFRGLDGFASASCELRKRSSRSNLSTEELKLLVDNGISYETVHDTEETFKINPAYFNDSKLLEKVAKALESVDGLPSDFIVHEEGKTRHTVAEQSLDQVFQVQNAKIAAQLLNVVGTLALKPKLDSGSIADAMKLIQAELAPEGEEA